MVNNFIDNIDLLIIIISQYPECNILDYLCYHCQSCRKYLCKKHYHNENSCPFLDKTKIIYQETNSKISNQKNINTICSFCSIMIHNNKGYFCDFCKKEYCLKHRLEIDHKCPESIKISMTDKNTQNKNMIMDKIKNLKKK